VDDPSEEDEDDLGEDEHDEDPFPDLHPTVGVAVRDPARSITRSPISMAALMRRMSACSGGGCGAMRSGI